MFDNTCFLGVCFLKYIYIYNKILYIKIILKLYLKILKISYKYFTFITFKKFP